MSNKLLQSQRDRLLLKQKGRCYYCKQPMLRRWEHRNHVPVPDNLATLEHLDSRWSPERGVHPFKKRHVAACRKCNNDRAIEEGKNAGLEELRRRRGSYPLNEVAPRSIGTASL